MPAEGLTVLLRAFRLPTMAAIDRVVRHATILEFNQESVRGQQARGRQKGQADAPEGPFGSRPSTAWRPR